MGRPPLNQCGNNSNSNSNLTGFSTASTTTSTTIAAVIATAPAVPHSSSKSTIGPITTTIPSNAAGNTAGTATSNNTTTAGSIGSGSSFVHHHHHHHHHHHPRSEPVSLCPVSKPRQFTLPIPPVPSDVRKYIQKTVSSQWRFASPLAPQQNKIRIWKTKLADQKEKVQIAHAKIQTLLDQKEQSLREIRESRQFELAQSIAHTERKLRSRYQKERIGKEKEFREQLEKEVQEQRRMKKKHARGEGDMTMMSMIISTDSLLNATNSERSNTTTSWDKEIVDVLEPAQKRVKELERMLERATEEANAIMNDTTTTTTTIQSCATQKESEEMKDNDAIQKKKLDDNDEDNDEPPSAIIAALIREAESNVEIQSEQLSQQLQEAKDQLVKLNKSKLEMIWLMKQVIKAEQKQKLMMNVHQPPTTGTGSIGSQNPHAQAPSSNPTTNAEAQMNFTSPASRLA